MKSWSLCIWPRTSPEAKFRNKHFMAKIGKKRIGTELSFVNLVAFIKPRTTAFIEKQTSIAYVTEIITDLVLTAINFKFDESFSWWDILDFMLNSAFKKIPLARSVGQYQAVCDAILGCHKQHFILSVCRRKLLFYFSYNFNII